MPTAVSICSNAMLRLGAEPISSFTEADQSGSNIERARIAANLWPTVRQAALRAHPWNCATKRVLLSPETVGPAFGFANRFLLPADWLRTLQVGEDPDSLLDFELEGREILSDEGSIPLVYVYDNDNPGTYDASLVDALEVAMAAAMAYPITKSSAARDTFADEFLAKIKTARTLDGMDNPPQTFGDSRLRNRRRGGG
jgi:hypothetical protein